MRTPIGIVTSTDLTMRAFLVDHIRALAAEYDVTLVSNFDDADYWERAGIPVRIEQIDFKRPIAPAADARALAALIALFRRERFQLVHSVTPKAGLLSAIAGSVTGVPIRAHTCTGQVWATRHGAGRAVLKTADRVMVSLLTDVLVDSRSQRDFLESSGVLIPKRGLVLGDGSISGVDERRFHPDAAVRACLRRKHGIADSDVVLLYIGRLAEDKGVMTLASAFRELSATHAAARLVVVGPDEGGLLPRMLAELGDAARCTTVVGFSDRPEAYMQMSDVICLPSRREGFGTVLLEAAAVGLPAIATRIYGIIDAVEDARGGILVPPDDAGALRDAMRALVDDPERRAAMGEHARARALRDFSRERITSELMRFYAQRLAQSVQ